jgi:hypothetical protein
VVRESIMSSTIFSNIVSIDGDGGAATAAAAAAAVRKSSPFAVVLAFAVLCSTTMASTRPITARPNEQFRAFGALRESSPAKDDPPAKPSEIRDMSIAKRAGLFAGCSVSTT